MQGEYQRTELEGFSVVCVRRLTDYGPRLIGCSGIRVYTRAMNSRNVLRRLMSAGVLAILGGTAFGQQPQPIVLKAARFFDGRQMRTPGVVVVIGSRIAGVGANATVPAGARTIETVSWTWGGRRRHQQS